ncbi:hypothetical protein [Kaarinaea lacus]
MRLIGLMMGNHDSFTGPLRFSHYCHDNKHQRQLDAQQGVSVSYSANSANATYTPFSDLKDMLDKKDK